MLWAVITVIQVMIFDVSNRRKIFEKDLDYDKVDH